MSPNDGVPPEDPPGGSWLEARVTRLEDEMAEIRASLHRLELMITRIDATLMHMATRSEVMDVRSELKEDFASLRSELKGEIGGIRLDLADVKVALAEKPSRAYMWGIVTAMVGAFACGLAALAVLK